MLRIPVSLREHAYEIVVGAGLLHDGGAAAVAPFAAGRSCLLLTDSNVAPFYAAAAGKLLAAAGAGHVAVEVFPAGEESKTLATMGRLYAAAIRAGLDRKSLIVGLGGGVTTDMSGFLAATYMRGIDYLQIPTSLLAQVDSAIGGKTGVDLPEGKNLVGAFWQPRLVLIDTDTIKSLPPRQLRCGLAEVVKYGVIQDAAFFGWLEEHVAGLLAGDSGVYAQVVRRCSELKAEVVVADELDLTGVRAILNYGHTFGHALETLGGYSAYTHGEGVALGMGMAADLALASDPGNAALIELRRRQDALLAALGLPLRSSGVASSDVLALMRRDKKSERGSLRLILPERLGRVHLVKDVSEAAVCQAVEGRCDQP